MRGRGESCSSHPALTITLTLGVNAMADAHVIARAAMRNHARHPLSPMSPSSTTQYARLLTRLLWCLALERALATRDATDPGIDAAIRAAERAWSACRSAALEMLARPCARPEDLLAVRAAAAIRALVEARDTPDAGRRYYALSQTLAQIECAAGDAPRGLARMLVTTHRCLMNAARRDGAPLILPVDLPPVDLPPMELDPVVAAGRALPPAGAAGPDAPAL